MVAPIPPGTVPNIGTRFERDPGKSRKGLMGSMRSHCPETKQPEPLARASQPEGEMKTRGSWSSTPDVQLGTEFAGGVLVRGE